MAIVMTDILFYIVQAVIFWGFCHYALRTKAKKLPSLILTVTAFLAMFGFRQLLISSHFILFYNIFFVFTIDLLCFIFIYRQGFFASLANASVQVIFVLVSEYIVLSVEAILENGRFKLFYNNVLSYFFANLSVKITYAVLSFIFARLYRKYNDVEDNTGYLFLFIITVSNSLIFILIDLLALDNREQSVRVYIIWVVCAVFSYIAVYLVFYYRNNMIEQSLKIGELSQKEFDEQYYAVVENSNQNLQILSHDFKNHLIQIENAKDLEEVKAYVAQLYPELRSFSAVSVSENRMLNLLVSKYNTLCAVKGIDFCCTVEGTSLEILEPADLTALLSNLLDNALEAAEISAQKKITLHIYNKNEKTAVIVIENSCDKAPNAEENVLISTKKDHVSHGYGLKSVKRIVKKYRGFYAWEYDAEQKRFVSTLSFYISN